jgi:type VI protein secretion system component VasK
MFKGLVHDMVLAVQTRTGITTSFFVWLAIVWLAALTAFAFLCVAAYVWLSLQLGGVYAGLVMAAVFVLIAIIGSVVCLMARRRARERAILERAARAHAPSWLLDPKILATAVQVGRSLGWQRVIPLALVGIMVAQWAREHRERSDKPVE